MKQGIRQTSIDCYHQIKKEGLLSKKKLQVYEALIDIAPCTAQELESYLNKNINVRGGWKLLSVLREQGAVVELGSRKCNITGRNVIEWDVSDKLPNKLPNKLTKNKVDVNKVIDAIILYMDKNYMDSISQKTLKSLKQ